VNPDTAVRVNSYAKAVYDKCFDTTVHSGIQSWDLETAAIETYMTISTVIEN